MPDEGHIKILTMSNPHLPKSHPNLQPERNNVCSSKKKEKKGCIFMSTTWKMLEVCRAYEYANHYKHIASSMKAQTYEEENRTRDLAPN